MMGFFIVLAVILLIVAVITMIIFAAVNRDKPNAYRVFSNGVRTIFAYIFIIFSLLSMVFGTIIGVNSILNYYYPNTIEVVSDSDTPAVAEDKKADNDMKNINDIQVGLVIQNEKRDALQQASASFSFVLISIPLFIYFNKQARKIKKENI